MARLDPLRIEQLTPELQVLIHAGEELMGFTPSDGLTMAHAPAILEAMLQLVRAVYDEDGRNRELKQLVGLMSSAAAGCRYCKGHAYYGGLNRGIEQAKLDAIWEYETSPCFDAAERAALRVAHLGSLTPNHVSDKDMAELRCHFSDAEVAELVAVIAMFGFLNRWNDTIKTDLEPGPERVFAGTALE